MNTHIVTGVIITLTLGTMASVDPDLFPAALGQQPTPEEAEKMIEDIMPEEWKSNPRMAEIFKDVMIQGNASSANPDMAKLLIYSDTSWSTNVLDSGLDSFTQDGTNDSVIDFECKPEFMSTYSVSAQKDTEAGYVMLVIVQNFRGIDAGMTSADYGIVSLAGECGKPPTSE